MAALLLHFMIDHKAILLLVSGLDNVEQGSTGKAAGNTQSRHGKVQHEQLASTNLNLLEDGGSGSLDTIGGEHSVHIVTRDVIDIKQVLLFPYTREVDALSLKPTRLTSLFRIQQVDLSSDNTMT